jgi:hypothetical protein
VSQYTEVKTSFSKGGVFQDMAAQRDLRSNLTMCLNLLQLIEFTRYICLFSFMLLLYFAIIVVETPRIAAS